jgi:hypothetical protein
MRVHTAAVPATKYLPMRIHCKFTTDSDVPNNVSDKTFEVGDHDEPTHDLVVKIFLEKNGLADHDFNKIGHTLTKRGYKYDIVGVV